MKIQIRHAMKIIWPSILSSLLLLLSSATATADPTTISPALLDILRAAPTAVDYPRDDAVWISKDMSIIIDPSGTYTVNEHKLLKILNERGMAAAQWTIPYDTACETLTINCARTLLDGKAYPIDPQQVRESAIYPGINWYDTMVVKRFPLPAVAVGAVLEVDTTLHRLTPRVPGAFSTRLYLQQRYPMREAHWQISSPARMPLTIRFSGQKLPPVQHVLDGERHCYDWTIPQASALRIDELDAPGVEELTPTALITSLTDWQPVVRWYEGISAGKDTLTDVLRQVALTRTHDCTTTVERITVLHKVVRELPYIASEMGDLSDIPHAAIEVAQHNYGDCKDKATLLRALLQAVGISSDYVLVRTTNRGKLDHQQYGPDEFNHVLLVAYTSQRDYYLDATIADAPADALPPGVDGAEGLIIHGKGTLVSLPASAAVDNSLDARINITVKTDYSATGKVTLTLTGINAMLQRGSLARLPIDRYRDALQDYLATRLGPDIAVNAVTVNNLHAPEYPLRITADFSSPTYLQPADDKLAGRLSSFAYLPNQYRAIKTRNFPFLLPEASSLSEETTIALPNTLIITRLPTPIKFHSAIGDYADKISARGSTISYSCRWSRKRGVFSPKMLESFSQWSGVLAQEGRNQLQFYLRAK